MVNTIIESKRLLGKPSTVEGVLSCKRSMIRKDDNAPNRISPYLLCTIRDITGSIDIPLWDNFQKNDTMLNEGNVIRATGIVERYKNKYQLSNITFSILNRNPMNYMPAFNITQDEINYFNNVINSLKEPYHTIAVYATGYNNVNPQTWNEFILCPASERYHHAALRGLFIHTIGVMRNMGNYINNYILRPSFLYANDVVNKDRCMLIAMIHDIMKIKEYEYKKGFIRRKDLNTDHRIMGVMYINEINNACGNILSDDDLDKITYSILSHHGQYGGGRSGEGIFTPKTLEDIWLNLSDQADSSTAKAINEYNSKIE